MTTVKKITSKAKVPHCTEVFYRFSTEFSVLTGTVKDIGPRPTPVKNLPIYKTDVIFAPAIMIQPATNGKEHIIMLNFRPNLSMV